VPVLYRRATADDAGAVARLHADSWRRNYRGAFSDAFLDGDVLADRMAVWTERLRDRPPDGGPGGGPDGGLVRRPAATTVVAEDGGVVIGFAHTVFDHDPTWGALLDNLHVTHDRKRSGVGRVLLVRSAAAVVEREPSDGLYLWVLEQNRAAQAFYRALGGRCVERGLASPPGGGSPARFRFAWPDPAVLLFDRGRPPGGDGRPPPGRGPAEAGRGRRP
jgi:ribosomal protein S18 acetylase RimI-like enzyme